MAVAGRNPADITLPTLANEASGGDVALGGATSGLTGSSTTASITTANSSTPSAGTSGTGEVLPADGPAPASGSHLTPQPGGYAGGALNPMNWRRLAMTGDANAPDEYYQAADVGAGEYVAPRIAPTIQTVGGILETSAGAGLGLPGTPY